MNKISNPSAAWQMRLFPLMTALGWILILTAFIIGAFTLAPTAASYFGDNAKAVRDAAEAGSALIGSLGTITSIPRWLKPLAFLGVASFMVGIALEFSTIPALLANRAEVMKACFPLIIKVNKSSK